MLTPADIRKRAERSYREVLRAWLADEPFTPLEYSVGRLPKDLIPRRQAIEVLHQSSYEIVGSGYVLQWATVSSKQLGKQTLPQRVQISTLQDFLELLHKRNEFKHFVADVGLIRQQLPALEPWLHAAPEAIIEVHGVWPQLLAVCRYFLDHPRPNVYIRELPISVHTKFIETHMPILRELFDILLPDDAIQSSESDFTLRYGLKDKPTLARLRCLDDQLKPYGLLLDDLTLPLPQLAHLLSNHIKPRCVLIVENLINFLTLPHFPNTIGVFGGGFAVHNLRSIDWFKQCHIVYWGDIDVHGFEILSDVRGIFPHTYSVMMNAQTLTTFTSYRSVVNPSRTQRFEHLTSSELVLAHQLAAQHWRLEQEHIPHHYAVAALDQILAPLIN